MFCEFLLKLRCLTAKVRFSFPILTEVVAKSALLELHESLTNSLGSNGSTLAIGFLVSNLIRFNSEF